MASFVANKGTPTRSDGYDPVTASASADAYGRVGLVAWAIFSSHGGHVLTFDKLGEPFSIEVDGRSADKAAFEAFSVALAAAAGRMTP